MLNNPDYQLYPITIKHLQEVLKFVSTHYVANEPLSIHLGVQPNQFSSTYEKFISQCCLSEISFCFRFSQQIVAVILALPLQGYLEPIRGPQKLKPIQIIMETLDKMYEPQHPEKTLSIFIGCTHPLHMRKGLFTRLLQQNQKKAIQKGYMQIFTECTNKKSENAFSKQGYQEKAWICYENFEFNGQYPFKGIKNAERVCAMTKNINQKIKQ